MIKRKWEDEELTLESFAQYLLKLYPWWSTESVDEMVAEAGSVDALAMKASRRKYSEAEDYWCVQGCCVVTWHPVLGNTGGMGLPGCKCELLEDPRGEKL